MANESAEVLLIEISMPISNDSFRSQAAPKKALWLELRGAIWEGINPMQRTGESDEGVITALFLISDRFYLQLQWELQIYLEAVYEAKKQSLVHNATQR